MFPNRSRISPLKLAGIGAIAATALAVAPTALAATSGGAPLPPASAHVTNSSPFTIGLSSTTVKPGAKLTISGLAYARAGLNLTILSDAIASARSVNGVPAVQTPALVEGIYHTTVRVPPATKPGVYSVNCASATARSPRSATCVSSLPVRRPAGRRGSIGVPASGSPSCTTTAPAPPICRPAGTPSPAATWTAGRHRPTSRASSPAPGSRSPGGPRHRRPPAARASPSATAGLASASPRHADRHPDARQGRSPRPCPALIGIRGGGSGVRERARRCSRRPRSPTRPRDPRCDR